MATIYYDNDADLNLIKEKTIAIIGYGNQGRSQALNIRDSGIKNVIIGSRKDESYDQANEDGFMVYSIEEASKKADIIYMLLPDEVAPQIYEEKIAPNLKDGNIINFSSAYNITFKRIVPAKNLDIVMAAPRMIGKGVRELYEKGEGSPAFVGVHQDYSGKALEYAKALCKAIGATRKGAIEVKFDDETFLDLMAEQGTWPIIYNVFVEAFKLQVEMGHPEEAVLMEMYLSKEPAVMMEKAAEVGFFKQLPYHSNTSQYGQLIGFNAFDSKQIREFLKNRYDRIKNGVFAEEWDKEQKENNLSNLNKLEQEALDCEFSKAEDRLKKRLK
ncbi:ketol-acid reductoisomerase [Brachyspira pilosicoli]|uniref:ketol-acid reductoisomerase n=1 Tax=Brachyspira pilosicoli TaxID=52584 RepID=UPI000E1461B5|nr:ketol-acid reductoisomerase [Brachyspira pilosicoli]MBW5391950.1 ketol-acid reductoisomerase [Brachyspira pilosicoli]WIH83542.1 ketol-acid reductoisomerase [Brachyspira pilosicoli]SUW09565.1 ketol-acid reductoisomerase [Brachyspira pilosicoli]